MLMQVTDVSEETEFEIGRQLEQSDGIVHRVLHDLRDIGNLEEYLRINLDLLGGVIQLHSDYKLVFVLAGNGPGK